MRRALPTLAVLILLAVVYVLSYAPVCRFCDEPGGMFGGNWPVYRPVEWLIDETPSLPDLGTRLAASRSTYSAS